MTEAGGRNGLRGRFRHGAGANHRMTDGSGGGSMVGGGVFELTLRLGLVG